MVKKGDKVEWDSRNGKTHGKVVDTKETKNGKRFEVESDKTGKTAVHKEDALKKK